MESSCECGYEPSSSINAGNLSSGYIICGLSSRSQFHRVSDLLNSTSMFRKIF
jgi:hypothetical protein